MTHNGPGTPPTPDPARRREQRAWCAYEWAIGVFQASVVTVFLSGYLTGIAAHAARASGQPCASTLRGCDIHGAGITIPAGALWGYLLSAATVAQIIVLPVVGVVADRTRDKRPWLAGFALAGAASTAAMAMVDGNDWVTGSVLFIVANGCAGASRVVYNAYLPAIATADERDQVSLRSWAYGYLGGGVALVLHLGLTLGHGVLGISTDTAVRLCLVTAGLWWAVFTLPPLRVLGAHGTTATLRAGWWQTCAQGIGQFGRTLRQAATLPITLAFLGAYLIFYDAINTVASVASQYGGQELHLGQTILVATILIVQFVAYLGGLAHRYAARRVGAKRTLVTSLLLWILVIAAATLVPARAPAAFFAVAVGVGLLIGGTNALARSVFSQLIPRGREAEYFAFYGIAEGGTSWLGPTMFAVLGQTTGSYRQAIGGLAILFILGAAATAVVPIRRGIRNAGNPEPTRI